MDLKDLQRILEKEKGKIIIVENGKPIMLVLPYENPEPALNNEEIAESLQEDEDTESGELTIDDLPI